MNVSMTELQRFGYEAENAFQAAAAAAGYSIQPYSSNFQSEFDFMIDGILPVEVKAARPCLHRSRRGGGLRWRWQFNLSSLGSDPGRRDFILVLACWVPSQQAFEFFILPSAYLLDRPFMCQITSSPADYRGWLARFLGCWQSLDLLSARLRLSVNGYFAF